MSDTAQRIDPTSDAERHLATYKAVRAAATLLATVPRDTYTAVDQAYDTLHAAYWAECPEPAGSDFPRQFDRSASLATTE